MSRVCYRSCLLLTGLLLLAGAGFGESTAFAQEKVAPEPVRIVTVDGVKLNAVFYKGNKSSSTVIMLHPIGEGKNIRMPGWKKMAEKLNEAGYAVVMFDFRGHGDSTTIDSDKDFYSYPPNLKFKLKDKESIEYKDYKVAAPSYLPVLVNDIAAVRTFLDRKNDAGACNTSNIIVIGADQGATLGAVWMNSEWNRYKYTFNNFMQPDFDKSPAGKDIIAAVFLTIQPKLSTRPVNLGSTLKIPCRDNATATVFFYGKDDAPARTLAKELAKSLKPAKAGKKYDFIGPAELETKLSGVQLLQDGLDTDQSIVKYVEAVVADRGNEWIERDSTNSLYMWRYPTPVPAKKQKGQKNLEFSDYQKYVQ